MPRAVMCQLDLSRRNPLGREKFRQEVWSRDDQKGHPPISDAIRGTDGEMHPKISEALIKSIQTHA
jgi:hypothetical protein